MHNLKDPNINDVPVSSVEYQLTYLPDEPLLLLHTAVQQQAASRAVQIRFLNCPSSSDKLDNCTLRLPSPYI